MLVDTDEFVIVGLTKDGKRFRPSDWAERLCGVMSQFGARRAPIPRSPEEKAAFEAAMKFPRQALHAGVLGFFHPTKQKKMRFESPWPEDFQTLMKALRELNSR